MTDPTPPLVPPTQPTAPTPAPGWDPAPWDPTASVSAWTPVTEPTPTDPVLTEPVATEVAAGAPPRRTIARWLFVAVGVTSLALFGAAYSFRQSSQSRHRAEQIQRDAEHDAAYQQSQAIKAHADLQSAQVPARDAQTQVQTPAATAEQLDGLAATAQSTQAAVVQAGETNASVDQYNHAVDADNALSDQWNGLVDKLNDQAGKVVD